MVFNTLWGHNESNGFWVFFKKNQAYKSICDRFSEPFNLLFVKALDYYHQIDLHLKNKSNFSEEEKENFQRIADACEYLGSEVNRNDEKYFKDIKNAFNAFTQQHKNDKPVYSRLEFQQLLESFLEVVEKQINPRPPQEQPNLFVVPSFLSHIYQIPSLGISLDVRRNQIIFSDSRLSPQDKSDLIRLVVRLQKDSDNFFLKVDVRDNLQNQGLRQTGTISLVDAYKEAIMGAYAMFLASTPEALEDIPEKSRDSIKQSLELKNCLALSWTIHTQSQNQ
jgi:hypothetical protein